MSSMYKGLLTVVVMTAVTSAMILMTGTSVTADNKNVLESGQSKEISNIGVKTNKVTVQNKLTEGVVISDGNKTSLVDTPPPPGPFFYGSTVGEGIGVQTNVQSRQGLHLKKPQAPAMPIPSKPNIIAPTKPLKSAESASLPNVKTGQSMAITPNLELPKQPEKKINPPQINNSNTAVLKAPDIAKPVLEKPELSKLQMPKPVAPTLNSPAPVSSLPDQQTPQMPVNQESVRLQKTMPIPNIQGRTSPPALNVQAPVLQQKSIPVPRFNTSTSREKPTPPVQQWKQQGSSQFAPVQPQNIIPSYQMPNPTVPTFYYYYPLPNWNTNNQVSPYYGYQLAPEANINAAPSPRMNSYQGQQLKEQSITSPSQNNNAGGQR